MKKIILDCDPGMDDSMAIVLAGKSKQIDLLAVTTVTGNYPVEITSINARKSLEMIQRQDVPVGKGMGKPLIREVPTDPFTHGEDGQAEMFLKAPVMELEKEDAVDLIIRLIKKYPKEITFVSTAPMTNLSLAMIKAPEIKELIKEIIAISGAFGLNEAAFFNATGDTPQSEWNVYVDPEAADIVYRSGVKLTAIGLDIATYFNVDFTDAQVKELKQSEKEEAKFLSNAIEFVRKRGYGAYCTVIDCMAVASVIETDLIETIPLPVGIETKDGITLGMTVADRRKHHAWTNLPIINVACKADYNRFLELIMETVLA